MQKKCVRGSSRVFVGAAVALLASQLFVHAARAESGKEWTTYGGDVANTRYSTLNQITPGNVKNLEQKWVLQDQVFGAWESNPLVVDGIMYVTERPNDVMAIGCLAAFGCTNNPYPEADRDNQGCLDPASARQLDYLAGGPGGAEGEQRALKPLAETGSYVFRTRCGREAVALLDDPDHDGV